ncbi:MAG: RNA pseudouridine synthase, partial [Proteobacteria bacterium]|nr:RNA pseudouridine synthase [Pseudomonadota bacterium]
MYGVLVVEATNGQLGYLAAFSGNNSNEAFTKFAPPIFDMSNKNGFFKKGESELNSINDEVKVLENSRELNEVLNRIEKVKLSAVSELNLLRTELKTSKIERDKLRKAHASSSQKETIFQLLVNDSKRQKSNLNQRKKYWKIELEKEEAIYANIQVEILRLKTARKTKSALLQQELFSNYTLLNAKHEAKNLVNIFFDYNSSVPPAAAGECAAPKLLQYAFKNDLKPIAIAEFWWGASPKSTVRKQGYFYAACQSKCKPILNHMLLG